MKIAKDDRWTPWVWAGVGFWIAFGLVLGVLALLQPRDRSLIPVYVDGVTDFWNDHRVSMNYAYNFLYLPASRVLFSPFAYAGIRWGGLLWRLLSYSLITVAALSWARLLAAEYAVRAFAMILVLLFPTAAGVLRNGQFDAITWALMALSAAAVAKDQWWRAAAGLGVAFALKPTAVVAVLLMGTVWPSLGMRLVPVVAVTFVLPFINPDWTYVGQLYADWLQLITGVVQSPGPWNDLGNALAVLGLAIPFGIMTLIRGLAAVATLALGMVAVRRLPRVEAAFTVLMLTAAYLLLFNPRAEGTSYFGLALVAAPMAARLALVEGSLVKSGIVAAFAILPGMIGLTATTLKLFNIWLDPLLSCIFVVMVIIPRTLDPATWTIRVGDTHPAMT